MDVEIGDVSSTVRAVDNDSLLAPQTMDRIMRAVLQAMQEQQAHAKRVRAERRVTGGVSQEQEEEDR
jgi:hypothetical protein